MDEFSETDLVGELSHGNESAFNHVYRAHRDSVFGFVYRMTYDRGLAEDLTHETFVFLIENPERFDPQRGSLRAFLCGIARGRLSNLTRRRYRRDVAIDETIELSLTSQSDGDPLADLLKRELGDHVEACIAQLPEVQREVFILREYHELSYDDLARVTGCEIATVKSRLHRARHAMASALAAYIKPIESRKYHEVC